MARLLLLGIGLAWLVFAGSADASKFVHRVVAEGPGVGAGQVSFASSTPSADVAVNVGSVVDGSVDPLGESTDGYVYVVDEANHRIQVFSAGGEFRFMWGLGVVDGGSSAQVCDRADSSCTGGFAGSVGGAFNSPQGVAIDQDTGHVFVRERANLRVQEFTAAGVFVRAWGWDVVQEGTSGDTLTDEFETCFEAAECKAGSSGTGLGQFGSTSIGKGGGIDVRQSTGDVFVGDLANRRVEHFDVPAATTDPVAVVAAFGSSAQFAASRQPGHIAIDDAEGVLYASDGGTGAENGDDIERYDLDGDIVSGGGFMAPISISAETATTASAATRGLEIDPATGNLYIARDVSVASGGRFSPVLELADTAAASPTAATLVDTHVESTDVEWKGMGFDPDSGDLYLGGIQGAEHWILAASEGPLPAASVVFSPYTAVSATGGTVNFSIETNGLVPVGYEVQLDNPASPNGFVTVASGEVDGSADPVVVSEVVSGLRPGSVYAVRVITATRFNNPTATTDSLVPLMTAAIAPGVSDVRADDLSATGVRLAARVNPHSRQTDYRFEWGTTGFDHAVPVPDGVVGNGPAYEFVSERLAGLEPSTTYRFRLVATNVQGTTTSPTHTFTTPAETDENGRAFELVSPADKAGGQGVGFWPWGLGHLAAAGVAAHQGERFMLSALFGSNLSNDQAFGLNTDLMLAERVDGQQGWKATPVLSHPNYQPILGQSTGLSSASDDLSTAYWTTPSTMVLFPEMAGPNPDPAQPNWSLFDAGWLSGWDGAGSGPTRWELFGPRGLTASEIAPRSELPGELWQVVVSADGSAAVGATSLTNTGRAAVFGLGGPNDPSSPGFGDLVAGGSLYAADLSGGLSDTFAGVGPRELVNVCTGSPGIDRTVVPAVDAGAMAGQECPAGNAGRQRLISDHGAAYSADDSITPAGVVSRGGSRVFFLSPDPRAPGVPNGVSSFCSGSGESTLCPPQLFVRQRNEDGSTVTRWISKAEDGLLGTQAASLTGGARFEGASKDGSVVYFRTNSPLTADDPNGEGAPTPGGVTAGSPDLESWDLYRFELSDGPDPTGPGSSLTRVSAGPGGDGDCNSPWPSIGGAGDNDSINALRFLSDDGDRAYFTCQAPLPAVAGTPDGGITTPGGTPTTGDQTNLYLYDADRPQPQRWRFVTRLPRSRQRVLETCASTGVKRLSPLTSENGYNPEIALGVGEFSNCVRGAGDGRFVTWLTTGRLTSDAPGGTPIDDVSGPPVADIYGYDASRDELVRVSGAQGGSEDPYPCTTDDPGTDHDERLDFRCRGDGGIDSQGGASVQVGPTNLGVVVDRVGGESVAFFQSASALVAEDLDDGYDVYEWRDGKLSLITSGAAGSKDALFKGNDRSGRNVYFVTRDALSWQDTDAVADVYSARVGGGIAEPAVPVSCAVLADGCQGPGAGAVAIAPGSALSGSGGNAVARPGVRLSLGRLSVAQRRRAARSGVLRVRVRSSRAGVVRVGVRARIAGRLVRVAGARRRLVRPGVATVRLRLSRRARRALGAGRSLRLVVAASQSGERSRRLTVRLPGDRS